MSPFWLHLPSLCRFFSPVPQFSMSVFVTRATSASPTFRRVCKICEWRCRAENKVPAMFDLSPSSHLTRTALEAGAKPGFKRIDVSRENHDVLALRAGGTRRAAKDSCRPHPIDKHAVKSPVSPFDRIQTIILVLHPVHLFRSVRWNPFEASANANRQGRQSQANVPSATRFLPAGLFRDCVLSGR